MDARRAQPLGRKEACEAEAWRQFEVVVGGYDGAPGALASILLRAHAIFGEVPPRVVTRLSALSGEPEDRIWNLVRFLAFRASLVRHW